MEEWIKYIGYGLTIITDAKIDSKIIKSHQLVVNPKKVIEKNPIYFYNNPHSIPNAYSHMYIGGWNYPIPQPYIGKLSMPNSSICHDKNEFNPPIVVKSAGPYFVVRDDKLLGGTKQRGLYTYVLDLLDNNSEIDHIAYAGPTTGVAQVALALVCDYISKHRKVKLQSSMFASGIQSKFSKIAFDHGCEMSYYKTLYDAQMAAKNWADRPSRVLLPFGLENDDFKRHLICALSTAMPTLTMPRRMWVVAGSAVLLSCLYYIFPTTYFMVVQVGRKIWPDQYDTSRTRIYVAPQSFTEETYISPPYASVSTYDAKVWQFVKMYGEDGDWIWNVAG